ncbi:hypothetical protein C8J57DRAFT_1537388 [Mycena rebaudengoi]|nr:hypothetical protein C8J57DRAFT_1537388 [Mycena rebaudengoi]
MHRADDALATPDPHDTLSTSASHGALAWSDPRDTLHARLAPPRCAVSLVLSTTTRSPRLTTRSPRLTARIHAGESPSLLSFTLPYLLSLRLVTPLAPSESAACAHMLRSAAADSEQRLAVEAYALAESQYGSISRAPVREARMRTRRSRARLQGRAREERLPASDSSTRGESSDSARSLVSTRTGTACSHRAQFAGALAREERLPDPPIEPRARRVSGLLRTFDASPARGVVVACTLARSVRALRTRSQETAPATLARSLRRLESHGRRFVHARAVSTRAHRFVSGLPFSSATRARFLSSKIHVVSK